MLLSNGNDLVKVLNDFNKNLGYLGDILEDLGHPLTEGLCSVVSLLKLLPKEYDAGSSEHPPKLVSTIGLMRKIS